MGEARRRVEIAAANRAGRIEVAAHADNAPARAAFAVRMAKGRELEDDVPAVQWSRTQVDAHCTMSHASSGSRSYHGGGNLTSTDSTTNGAPDITAAAGMSIHPHTLKPVSRP